MRPKATNGKRAKVLIVDDEVEALRAMGILLERKGGLTTLTAASGEEALQILSSEGIDIVITDLRMPGIDGLELLRNISDLYPELSVIISTGYASLDSAVDALRHGAVDYIQKPHSPRELIDKVDEILERRRKTLDEREEIDAVKEREAERTRDLLRAKEIQERWIPREYTGRSMRIVTAFHSVGELSGDFLDVVELDEHRLALVSGDVVGHGLPASLQMGIAQRLIKRDLLDGKPVDEVLTSINAFLYDEYHLDSAFAAFVAIFDERDLSLEYASGGHPPPILFSRSGDVSFVETSGPGLLVIPEYSFEKHEIALSSGERICIFTDGVIETRAPDGDLFGEIGLVKILDESRLESIDELTGKIVTALSEFRGGSPFTDDVSIILAEVLPA